MARNRSPGPPFGQGSDRAVDVEALAGGFDPLDTTALHAVKRVVHIVIGLRDVGLFVKDNDTAPLRLVDFFPYPDEGYPKWNALLQALRDHDEASDEFAFVRLTGHAFNNPRANALAVSFMRAGLAVSNQTFMADDNSPPFNPPSPQYSSPQYARRSIVHPKPRIRWWLQMLDGKSPGKACVERADNYSRWIERARNQWLRELAKVGRG